MAVCTYLHQSWGKSNLYVTLFLAAHVCESRFKYCEAITDGTKSECVRTVLYYVCTYLKSEDSPSET